MEDSKMLDISLEDIKISPELNSILKNLPKLRRQSNNFTCNLTDTTVDSDNSENLQSCGSVCVYNFQQQFIFNCEFCDLKYGDLDNFKRHLHEAHSLFQLEEEPVKENAAKNRQSSKVCTAVKKEPLEPPIDLPPTYFTEPLVSCGAVFIFNQQKLHLACGYCDCSKYDNLDMFEKHVKQQHNIFEGAHNELNVVPKVEVKEEVFLITEVVEPTEVKVEKEEPLEEGVLDIQQSYSDDEEEEDDEDDEENEIDEDDEEFIDKDDEDFIDEDSEDEEGEEDETEDEQNTSKATKPNKQEPPSNEPSTSSSTKTKRKSKIEEEYRFECDVCREQFPNKRSLHNHESLKCKVGGRFHCEHCSKRFKSRLHLTEHLRIHTGEKPYECEICQKRFRSQGNYNVHKKMHLPDAGNRDFNCEYCNKTFKKRPYLTEHLRTHTGEKPYECEICQKSFRSQGNYYIHQKRHLGDAGKTAECKECKKTYFATADLRNHIMKTHAKDESKKAESVELKNNSQVFNCDYCNKTFKKRPYLTEHMRTHTGEKPYECEICQKSFGTQGNYIAHKKIHLRGAGTTAECKKCKKTYFSNAGLRNHIMKTHTNKESKKAEPLKLKANSPVFYCEYCSKAFKKRTNLAAHLRTHTGEKPFECEKCHKRFGDPGNFSVHKKRHLDATEECDYCDKKFKLNLDLRTHIKRVHKEHAKT